MFAQTIDDLFYGNLPIRAAGQMLHLVKDTAESWPTCLVHKISVLLKPGDTTIHVNNA